MAWTFSSPKKFKKASKTGKWFLHNTPFVVNNNLNPWYKQRDMPQGPKESFSDWYIKKEKKKKKG